jgi:hypothetical protein
MMLMKTETLQDILYDVFSNSTLLDSIPTMTNSKMTLDDINTVVEMQLNNLPYDPHGFDARLSLGKYRFTIFNTNLRVSKIKST